MSSISVTSTENKTAAREVIMTDLFYPFIKENHTEQAQTEEVKFLSIVIIKERNTKTRLQLSMKSQVHSGSP